MSMIIKTLVQLKGESEPQQHFALVFDDIVDPRDFVTYRNALTTAVKSILTSEDGEYLQDECFFLIQLSEYISSSLDLKHDDLFMQLHELKKNQHEED